MSAAIVRPAAYHPEVSLREALLALAAARQAERVFNDSDAWEGVDDRRDLDLHDAVCAARAELYAAFARQGIGKALVDEIGEFL